MVTRDAKIGLLVGLAFILIVGILLSEHITSATTPQQAQLALAGEKVREAAATPTAPQPKLASVTLDPNPQPAQSVVTRDQLDSPRLPPTARIELGQPEQGQIKVIRIDSADPVAAAVPVKSETNTSTPPTKNDVVTKNDTLASNDTLARNETLGANDAVAAAETKSAGNLPSGLAETARQHGLELMAVDSKATLTAQPETPRESIQPITHGTKVKEYIAQPGDSLSRIASRQMGASTPQNQAAIIALNPSLQKDSNRILAGAKYLIPADAWAAAMGTPAEEIKPAQAASTEAKTPAKEDATNAAKTVVYEVKAGDSLWKIAEREVGSANAIAQIKALNADVLGESDVVKIGMKLKLPAKTKAA